MTMEELLVYQHMIERVRGEYSGRLSVKIGIEADFIPGYEEKTHALLAQYPYDYVYGSVHFIEDWAFDSPDERDRWNDADVNQIYHHYYELLQKAAQSGLFDIMSHVDLVKKFGYLATEDMSDEIRKTAVIFKKYGVAIEINTSGLRKEINEIYPSLDALRIYARENVDITFGSDAHLNTDVGRDFDLARDLALSAGYRDYVLFKKREIENRLPLS
jgi:histidinol-phosphatase (PHP family)